MSDMSGEDSRCLWSWKDSCSEDSTWCEFQVTIWLVPDEIQLSKILLCTALLLTLRHSLITMQLWFKTWSFLFSLFNLTKTFPSWGPLSWCVSSRQPHLIVFFSGWTLLSCHWGLLVVRWPSEPYRLQGYRISSAVVDIHLLTNITHPCFNDDMETARAVIGSMCFLSKASFWCWWRVNYREVEERWRCLLLFSNTHLVMPLHCSPSVPCILRS